MFVRFLSQKPLKNTRCTVWNNYHGKIIITTTHLRTVWNNKVKENDHLKAIQCFKLNLTVLLDSSKERPISWWCNGLKWISNSLTNQTPLTRQRINGLLSNHINPESRKAWHEMPAETKGLSWTQRLVLGNELRNLLWHTKLSLPRAYVDLNPSRTNLGMSSGQQWTRRARIRQVQSMDDPARSDNLAHWDMQIFYGHSWDGRFYIYIKYWVIYERNPLIITFCRKALLCWKLLDGFFFMNWHIYT